jgi:hypothetical protein
MAASSSIAEKEICDNKTTMLPTRIRLVATKPNSTDRILFATWDSKDCEHWTWYNCKTWTLLEYFSLYGESKIEMPSWISKQIQDLKITDLLNTNQLLDKLKDKIYDPKQCLCSKCIKYNVRQDFASLQYLDSKLKAVVSGRS